MTTPEAPALEAPSRSPRRRALANWGPTLLFGILLPLFTYFLLTGAGMAEVPALLISGGWPAVELGLSYALHRRFDEIAIMALLFIALGVVGGLFFNSARLVLIKEAIVTGLFGAVTLASLALPRPLMFYFGRKFATDGTPDGVAYWNGLWQYPTFRRTQRVITIVWGAAFLADALLRIGLSYALSTSAMAVISNVLPIAVAAALITWTISYGRRARAAGLAAAAQRAAANSPKTEVAA